MTRRYCSLSALESFQYFFCTVMFREIIPDGIGEKRIQNLRCRGKDWNSKVSLLASSNFSKFCQISLIQKPPPSFARLGCILKRKVAVLIKLNIYILSETRMLRNHYFSFFVRPKSDNLLPKLLLIVGVVC